MTADMAAFYLEENIKRNELPLFCNTIGNKYRKEKVIQMRNFNPQIIKGVLAFPNEEGKQEIRFIDAKYNTYFSVPDGANIILNTFEGEQRILPCEYIDDYHAQIGNSVYHICQFAENMEQAGAIYAPEHPREGDKVDTYEIYQIKNLELTPYAFRSYDSAKKYFQASDYQKVYQAMLSPKEELEDLFIKHNRDERPFGRRMHSLSVSDVVVLNRNGEKKAYYIDDFGFKEAPKFLGKEKKKKVNIEKERG